MAERILLAALTFAARLARRGMDCYGEPVLITALFVLAGAVLAFGATLRLTRLVTTDWLGEWWMLRPAKRWSAKYETVAVTRLVLAASDAEVEELQSRIESGDKFSWQGRLVKGLSCPFCVGFWLGLAVIIGSLTLGTLPGIQIAWWSVLGALALNYAVGHLSSRID